MKQTTAKQTRKKKKRKIRNLQTGYEEKETKRGKEEHTFKNAAQTEKRIHRVAIGAKSEW